MTPLSFGAACSYKIADQHGANSLLAYAERAEAVGLDHIWIGDHLVANVPVLDSLTVLAMIAARTKRIAIGTAVYLLPLRHPAGVAKTVASLDVLSAGRVIFGVGVGGEVPKEFEAAGVPIEQRGARTDDAIRALRSLWTEPRASYHGKYFSFDEVEMLPKPAQEGGPPIWVGGRSKAALRRAAENQGWMGYLVTPKSVAEGVQTIAEHRRHRALCNDETQVAVLCFTHISNSRERSRATAAAFLSGAYKQPFDNLVDKYCVLGSPGECVETIERLIDVGVRHVIMSPVAEREEAVEQLERFARDVVPLLRGRQRQ